MKQQWQQLLHKFNELTLRERGLIIASISVLLLLGFYLPIESYINQYQVQQRRIENIKQSNQSAQQLIKEFEQRLTLDPNEDYRRQLESLSQELSEIDNQFTIHNFIPASYMPTMLADLLAKTKGIKLQDFKSIKPEPLLQLSNDNDDTNLYSHGMTLSIQGDYFSILKFITAVEAMPNKLYWKSMDYQVAKYPKANVNLEFYTLSINKDFISVAN